MLVIATGHGKSPGFRWGSDDPFWADNCQGIYAELY